MYKQAIFHSLHFYVTLIEQGQPFSFARYGDGEWRCVLGDDGPNCDGHEYFPALRLDLRRTLAEPRGTYGMGRFITGNYMYALGRSSQRRMDGQRVKQYIEEHGIEVEWFDGEVFHVASQEGKLRPLVEALRNRRILYVGPPHLRRLPEVGAFDIQRFVEVPEQNCYLSLPRIRREIAEDLSGIDLVGFSAGPTTKVLIWSLYPAMGQMFTMMDFGSLWDVYVGVKSRSYMTGNWEERIRANLGES